MLSAPFPYFGGKSRIAPAVWQRFGVVRNYVEPFFGSGAMLWARPEPFEGSETVNDADGMVANFWRAVQAEPDAVAFHADWPVNESDLHARHSWLVGHKDTLQARLEGSPEFYDAKAAGWWCWGMCCWIGSGFCSGKGPWQVAEVDGARQLVHLGDAGRGVNRQLVHLGDAGRGVNRKREGIYDWMDALAERLRRVRVCVGDWGRVCTNTPTVKQGLTAVFLDPPYADTASRTSDLYRLDSESVAHEVRAWAIANGDNPKLRIALCGYEGEHAMPESWEALAWKTKGGYGSQGSQGSLNSNRERIWFSPHCLQSDLRQPLLAGGAA
jgi:DNA adenine methylase